MNIFSYFCVGFALFGPFSSREESRSELLQKVGVGVGERDFREPCSVSRYRLSQRDTVVARIESWRHAAVLDVPVRCVPRVVITRSG